MDIRALEAKVSSMESVVVPTRLIFKGRKKCVIPADVMKRVCGPNYGSQLVLNGLFTIDASGQPPEVREATFALAKKHLDGKYGLKLA